MDRRDGTSGEGRRPLAALTLAGGAVLAATVFGLFFYHARDRDRTVSVTGAATQPFEADIAKWRVTLARQVPLDGLQSGYASIRGDLERFLDGIVSRGVPRGAIDVQPVNSYPTFDRDGQPAGYTLQQGLFVIAEDAAALEEVALNPADLLAGGALLQSSQLEYFYSAVDSLKIELLARATGDARRRAGEIVESSGGRVDRLLSARAGVFQITEPYSTEVSAFGMHNTATRRKEIKVTVHATYSVE